MEGTGLDALKTSVTGQVTFLLSNVIGRRTPGSFIARSSRGYQRRVARTADCRTSRKLDLGVPVVEQQAKLDGTMVRTVHMIDFLRSGRHRVAR